MKRLAKLPIWGDSSKSIRILRATQASCSLLVFICSIVVATQVWVGSGGVFIISAAWGSAVMGVVSIISALLIPRPAEIWQLACTLDGAALVCGVISVVSLALCCIYTVFSILPLVAMLVSTCAFIITGYRTFSQHRRGRDYARPADPLKPYLIKKEIDVWCYPVQLDGARASKQYAMELFDLEQGPAPASSQQTSADDRDTNAVTRSDTQQSHAQSQKPQSTVAPPSVAETTAAWSVPSGNETYQTSHKAASTVLPSYAGPPSVNSSQSSNE